MLKRIINKILPPKEKVFFDYFQQSAEICDKLAVVFFDITHKKTAQEQLILARQLKRKNGSITRKVIKRLNTVFITPIDREDIQNICVLLDKIARTIAKGCSFINTYQLPELTDYLKQQTATLMEATQELKDAVLSFRNFKNTTIISESSERMDAIESQGDEIMYNAMSDLFSGKYDPLTVIKLRDLYKNVEQALDLCFLLSDTLVNVSLKHT